MRRFPYDLATWPLDRVRNLLGDPKKPLANVSGPPAIETENIFIKVSLEIPWFEASLEGTDDQALYQ
jgi:hypothetical protein